MPWERFLSLCLLHLQLFRMIDVQISTPYPAWEQRPILLHCTPASMLDVQFSLSSMRTETSLTTPHHSMHVRCSVLHSPSSMRTKTKLITLYTSIHVRYSLLHSQSSVRTKTKLTSLGYKIMSFVIEKIISILLHIMGTRMLKNINQTQNLFIMEIYTNKQSFFSNQV